MQSYPHIGLQRKGYQIFAEGAKRFLVAELRFGQRSGLSETGRRPMEDIQTDVEFRISSSLRPSRRSQLPDTTAARTCTPSAGLQAAPPSRRSRLNAALINPICVNACGKLPSASPDGPVSSAYSPRWFA
jgi:hypothetical protein